MVLWLPLLLVSAAPLLAAAARGKIVISEKGLTHLDSSGSLIDRRLFSGNGCDNKSLQCRIATNSRNGTLCWYSPEIEAVRCAQLDNLTQSWDLPRPAIGTRGSLDALAFDSIGGNWFLSWNRVSYVCSYSFDKCLKLGQSINCGKPYYVAYDTRNGLKFHVDAGCTGVFRLESERLDGTGLRVLQTGLKAPKALAVDPTTQLVFWLEDDIDGHNDGVFSVNYDGQGKQLVLTLSRPVGSPASDWVLDAEGGVITAMRSKRGTVRAVSASVWSGASGFRRGQTIPALSRMGELRAVTTFPPPPPPSNSDGRCASASCKDICIPTVENGTPAVSCICPEGFEVVDFTCQKVYPWYAVVAGQGALNLVDLTTEKVSTIVTVSREGDVDFLWTDDGTFLLFWVDGGNLFRGRWSPGNTVNDVRRMVTAGSGSSILEVAVIWGQRTPNIMWLEKDDSGSKSLFAVKLAPLDGSYSRTILSGDWRQQRGLFVAPWIGSYFGFNELNAGDVRQLIYDMSGGLSGSLSLNNFGNVNSGMTTTPEAFTVNVSPGGLLHLNNPMWVNEDGQKLEELAWNTNQNRLEHATVLTHPSLAAAGGLDVLNGRVFWTERSGGSSGRLWTADRRTGGAPRQLPTPVGGGGVVKLLHPWRQPPPYVQPVCDQQGTGCSHFCANLFTGISVAKCLCPDGMELAPDQKTCRQKTAAGGR